MRTGAAISVIVHLTAVTVWLLLAGVRPFEPTTAEAITVDIVPASEAPPPAKLDEPSKPETPQPEFPTLSEQKAPEPAQPKAPPPKQQQAAPQMSKPAPAPPPPQPQQQAAVQPQQQPQPAEQPPPQAAPIPYSDITQQFGKLISGENPEFDAPAAASANISRDSARALREHLKTCSVLPRSISPDDQVRIVLRVALLRDGKLAKEPLLIEASASAKGPALMKSAMDAILACQPYSVLPADKYDEWKVLDLSFTPKDFRS